jgi:hypothetical protein
MGINCPVLHCEAPVIRHEAPIRSDKLNILYNEKLCIALVTVLSSEEVFQPHDK